MSKLEFKKKLNATYGKMGHAGRLDADKWAAQAVRRLKGDKQVTGMHRLLLALELLHSCGLTPQFAMSPRPVARVGKLVHVMSVHAKRSIGFPEDGTLVGLLEGINGKRAMVRVASDRHVAVAINEITEVK